MLDSIILQHVSCHGCLNDLIFDDQYKTAYNKMIYTSQLNASVISTYTESNK